MFSAELRDRLRETLVERARADACITAAAALGASAGGGDRWSDLDLSFAIADECALTDVLGEWTELMAADHDAAVLFDLPHRSSIYRVFLLPGALQVDLSFTPAAEFAALGPQFHLLFGAAVERPWSPSPSPGYFFGLGVHHLVRAHICILRGRLWQAEYWIHEARDEAMTLAAHRRGLKISHGRGFDDLPADVTDAFGAGLVGKVTVESLRSALGCVIQEFVREGVDLGEQADRVRPILEDLLHDVTSAAASPNHPVQPDERLSVE